MRNNEQLQIIVRFLALLFAQFLIFNRMDFMGFINPMVYLLFLYWFPIKERPAALLLWSFGLGLLIDLFSDTMAIHSAALLTAAFFRPAIMRFCFGVNYEFQSFKLSQTTKAQKITYLGLLIVVHHIVFFSLEAFGWSHFFSISKKVLATALATLVICLLLISLLGRDKS